MRVLIEYFIKSCILLLKFLSRCLHYLGAAPGRRVSAQKLHDRFLRPSRQRIYLQEEIIIELHVQLLFPRTLVSQKVRLRKWDNRESDYRSDPAFLKTPNKPPWRWLNARPSDKGERESLTTSSNVTSQSSVEAMHIYQSKPFGRNGRTAI